MKQPTEMIYQTNPSFMAIFTDTKFQWLVNQLKLCIWMRTL